MLPFAVGCICFNEGREAEVSVTRAQDKACLEIEDSDLVCVWAWTKSTSESEATAAHKIYHCCWGTASACFGPAVDLARQNRWKGRRWGMSASYHELEEMTVCTPCAGGLRILLAAWLALQDTAQGGVDLALVFKIAPRDEKKRFKNMLWVFCWLS